MVVGDREGTGGGGALSYLYAVFGTAFMFNSTGRRPVRVCECVVSVIGIFPTILDM